MVINHLIWAIAEHTQFLCSYYGRNWKVMSTANKNGLIILNQVVMFFDYRVINSNIPTLYKYASRHG